MKASDFIKLALWMLLTVSLMVVILCLANLPYALTMLYKSGPVGEQFVKDLLQNMVYVSLATALLYVWVVWQLRRKKAKNVGGEQSG